MRAAIYGAGAMGTVLGAYITKNGGSIDLISRNREHIAALRSGGAHIVGEAEFTVPVKAYLPEEMEGEYDVIFLMTKQRHNAEILKFLSPYLAEDGVVCTTQNGLPEPLVGEIVGKELLRLCRFLGSYLSGQGQRAADHPHGRIGICARHNLRQLQQA